jgi:CHASE2 domain-containing sensor protein
MRNTQQSLERLGIIIVVLHFIVSVVHGAAHLNLHITLNNWQTIYVLVVITTLPLVSGVLLWRRMRGGFLLLFCSMIGSLLFGGYYHFIAAGADNVGSLGTHTWSGPFQLTAVLLAVTEATGAVTAVIGLIRKQ